jgi:hypothetical protein
MRPALRAQEGAITCNPGAEALLRASRDRRATGRD